MRAYAIGRLAVWVPAASPLDVEKNGLQMLVDPRVRHARLSDLSGRWQTIQNSPAASGDARHDAVVLVELTHGAGLL